MQNLRKLRAEKLLRILHPAQKTVVIIQAFLVVALRALRMKYMAGVVIR